VALVGHVIFALVAAAVIESQNLVVDLPRRRAAALG